MSYYIIRMLGFVGLVWDIREPTPKALERNLIAKPDATASAPEKQPAA